MLCSLHSTNVVLLGAGFSIAATDGKMPSMQTYFDQLTQVEAPELYGFIKTVSCEVATANVESVLLALEQIQNSPALALDGWADQWKQGAGTIRAQLAAYSLKRLKDNLDVDDENWAAKLLCSCGPSTTVISMNYDNIAERCLSYDPMRPRMTHGDYKPTCPHCKMRLLLSKACSCAGKGEIVEADYAGAIIKPHGSIAWRRCQNPVCCSYECLVADRNCEPFSYCPCPQCRQMCAPSMIMPSMNKMLIEVPEIGVMWNVTRRAISNAESIVVFGFSFPASDELLLQLIRSAIHTNKKLRTVSVIDCNPAPVIERFKKCLPSDIQVELIPLKVIPGQIPEWIA